MKRVIAHVITSVIALVILCLQLSKTASMALFLWFAPNAISVGTIVVLLLLNLKHKPVQIKDTFIVFCAAMLSTNFCVIISLFGNLFPLYQDAPLSNLQATGAFLNMLSMPFYVWAVLSLGRGFTILPEAHRLSARGIYKISRHPIYLTYVFWCITQNMIYQTGSVIVFSVIQIVLYGFRARCEEKVLSDTFPEYDGYLKRVMWLGTRKKGENKA
ncbi:MAG: isoprenylcysteine carboxylmethyltransferase family protein [Oscillospiraceae bacterium]|jgi:protein-S-isoprenylcysteine O-methyltransferase Ste14|nr:isoprenylcysteine carboxylmethyltransferase family protein [Oscillospiraceae bacterium]